MLKIAKIFSFYILCLGIFLCFLTHFSFGKNYKSKSKKIHTKNNKEKEKLNFKKMKDNMSIDQFKKLIELWNSTKAKKGISSIYNDIKNDLEHTESLEKENYQERKIYEKKLNDNKNKKNKLLETKPKTRKQKKVIKKNILELDLENKNLISKIEEKKLISENLIKKISGLKIKLKNLTSNLSINKNISDAELLLLDIDDFNSYNEKEKNETSFTVKKLENLIKKYKLQKNLTQEDHSDLKKYIEYLKNIIKKNKRIDNQPLNCSSNIKSINQILKDLERYYKTSGSLDKNMLYKVIGLLRNELKCWEKISNSPEKTLQQGLIFKVQIGAYKNKYLSENQSNSKKEGILEQKNIKNLNIYTLGTFKNYWEADLFKKKIRSLGIKDAYIIAFEDGKKKKINEILPYIKKNKVS